MNVEETNALERQLSALRASIALIEQQRYLLGETAESALLPLQEQATRIDVLLSQSSTGGGANVEGSVFSETFVGRDQINITANTVVLGYDRSPQLDWEEIYPRYLKHLIDTHRHVKLQGVRASGHLITISLEEVYVPLSTTVEVNGVPTRIGINNLLSDRPRVILLGPPGSGKTTFLSYMALSYARDALAESSLVTARFGLDESGRIPILVGLRDFGQYLRTEQRDSGTDGPVLLSDYLIANLTSYNITLPKAKIEEILKNGAAILLLDGIDEVADMATRARVARLIEKFTILYPTNRYLVTSRGIGYRDAARLGEGYLIAEINDFTVSDVEVFLQRWTWAVEVAILGNTEPTAQQRANEQMRKLLLAIRRNERIRELAINPLLLTVISTVQRYRAELPERRAELYEEAIDVLLGKWDESKGIQLETNVAGRILDAGDKRSLLEPVALWMQEQKIRDVSVDGLRTQLAGNFLKTLGDWQAATRAADMFIQIISERSGLIQERSQGSYRFSHPTFQEYLAARAITDRADYIEFSISRMQDEWWREVILLEVGYLSTQGKRRTSDLIRRMMDNPVESDLYYNLIFAAEALHDVGPARVEGDLSSEIRRRLRHEIERQGVPMDGGFTIASLRRWLQPKLSEEERAREKTRRRIAAAEALGKIETAVFSEKENYFSESFGEPVWVDISLGDFWMGSDSELSLELEHPLHRVFVNDYSISKTPITNLQYRIFTASTGYRVPRHWIDRRPPKGKELHPVVNVTWHDAMMYCGWLSRLLGKQIRLPSEAEWEKAARGHVDNREWPWGDKWDFTRCNNAELKVGGTTPVGTFISGASPFQVYDLAGNVWEWTISLLLDYPYSMGDGREDLQHSGFRVVRGGAWGESQRYVRCATRFELGPDSFNYTTGFRAVLVR